MSLGDPRPGKLLTLPKAYCQHEIKMYRILGQNQATLSFFSDQYLVLLGNAPLKMPLHLEFNKIVTLKDIFCCIKGFNYEIFLNRISGQQ